MRTQQTLGSIPLPMQHVRKPILSRCMRRALLAPCMQQWLARLLVAGDKGGHACCEQHISACTHVPDACKQRWKSTCRGMPSWP